MYVRYALSPVESHTFEIFFLHLSERILSLKSGAAAVVSSYVHLTLIITAFTAAFKLVQTQRENCISPRALFEERARR